MGKGLDKFEKVWKPTQSDRFTSLDCRIASSVLTGSSLNLQMWMTLIFWSFVLQTNITKTRLYNFDPLGPHFYIVKLGFTGIFIIFLTSTQKHRLWVLVRTASSRRF